MRAAAGSYETTLDYDAQIALFEADFAAQPTAVVASELAEDQLPRVRAERLWRQAAAVLVDASMETDANLETESRPHYRTLLEAAWAAGRGETEAVEFLAANVRSDVVERSIKAGHIMSIELGTDEDGRIMQHGQYLDDVHVNAFRYAAGSAEMLSRSKAETRNGKRIEHHHRHGRLQDHYFLEISQVAEMSDAELRKAGFFTDTMSWIVRVTGADGRVVTMQSAFIAGVTAPGAERHDAEMIAAVGDYLGVDYSGMSATQVLDRAVLIPKSMLPNGIVDLVRIADSATGTFFGQDRPGQDYAEYLAACRRREADLEPTVQQIVADLIAAAPYLRTPDDATARLHDLSEKHLVQRSLTDRQIDPMVFGWVSAGQIMEARYRMEIGDADGAATLIAQAESNAVSSSCPTGRAGGDAAERGNADGKSEKAGIKKMTCPFCKDPNQYGDPCSPNQHCTNCSARVINGKVTSEGDGGRKARLIRQVRAAQQLAAQRKKAAERSVSRRPEAADKPARLQAVPQAA